MKMAVQRNMLILFSVVIIASLKGVALAIECPDTWVHFEGSCYLFGTDSHLNFTDAVDFCSEHQGSYLVHVNTADENAFIKHFLNMLKRADFWMGLTDEGLEGEWVWNDDDTVTTLTDWNGGQPDDNNSGEDCAEFNAGMFYRWNDAACAKHVEPLCEFRHGFGSEVIG